MATVYFLESFDSQTTIANLALRWTSQNIDSIVTTGGARTGANFAQFSNNQEIRCNLTDVTQGVVTTLATIACGVAMGRFDSSVAQPIRFYDGANLQLYVQRNGTSNTISVVNGDGTVLATGTKVIDLQGVAWSYVEIIATIHASAGSFTCNIYTAGGNETLTGSGVQTIKTGAGNQVTGFALGTCANNQSNRYDDWWVADSLLGAVKIECKFPSGAGTTTQWTPDSGNNYARVNETNEDGDTSYVADATVGHIDTYAMTDLTATVGTVMGLQVTHIAKRDDATTRQFCPEFRSGGSNFDGATMTVTGTYDAFIHNQNTDPATSSAWSISSVNALEVGQKVVT